MDYTPSFRFGAALGCLARAVSSAQPGLLDADLARIDLTLFDLSAATAFFSRTCERVLNDPQIAIDDAVCAEVSTVFTVLSDFGSGKSEYEMYPALRGFISTYQPEMSDASSSALE